MKTSGCGCQAQTAHSRTRWQEHACPASEGFNFYKEPVRSMSPIKEQRTIPQIPIPPIPVEDRYPYRYCSAQPCQYETFGKIKKLRTCIHNLQHGLKEGVRAIDLKRVQQIPGYETTSMTASLQPFQKHKAHSSDIRKCHLSKAMLYPIFTECKAQGEFDKYISNQLYPRWKGGTRYKRRLVYKLDPIQK